MRSYSHDSKHYAKECITRNGRKLSKTKKMRNITKVVRHQESIQEQNLISDVNYLNCMASDGDSSDAEYGRKPNSEMHSVIVKIRVASMNLLAAVCRNLERHVVYGYYYMIFPNDSKDVNYNLIYLAKSDPSTHCRAAALQVGAQILAGSKIYFNQAECSVRRNCINFFPFSQSLGSMINVIYNTLFAILSTEASTFVLTQALKCLSVLVQATPFHKLETGIATGIVSHTRKLICHRDCNIQVAGLMVMEVLVSTSILTTEIVDIIGLPHTDSVPFISNNNQQVNMMSNELNEEGYEEFIETDESQNVYNKYNNNINTSESSWLLQHIIKNMDTDRQQSNVPASIYVKSINVLSALSCHFALLNTHLPTIVKVFQYALEDPLLDVQLNAARCLEKFSYEMSRYISNTSDFNCFKLTQTFWEILLPKLVVLISNSAQQNSAFKNYLCGSLANIGIVIYERLPYISKISLFSTLSGISNNSAENTIVRAAAIRALAVHVAFPSIRKNLVFVENTADMTLQFINDENLSVRVRAFWAMANVSDALVANFYVKERVSFDILTRLIEASKNACYDNDKVRCNAVRALGNFLSILTEDNFDNYVGRKMFNESIKKLAHCITSSSNAKVKWNAYYAVGNIFRNNTIFVVTEIYSDLEWQDSLYTTLCHTIVHHSNFKVRISAAIAIKYIKMRSYFQNYLNLIWSSLLAAVENSQDSVNLEEHEHVDNLQEQLCLAISHIIGISRPEDFPMLQKCLAEKAEIVSYVWLLVSNRMIPEKSVPLISCSIVLYERIKNLNQSTSDHLNAMVYVAKTLSLQEIFPCFNDVNTNFRFEHLPHQTSVIKN
ncbi:HEAT repeat-containing protein 6 isoform X2 [Teleopsis dalmanni]|uniref:HEAT repeat-containing protein 6 isoform X2 n=1 Tax=Teleopsis dalmanni TaxID=139649 RepID=UPI0018CDA8D2|nr:HEAT repeat-containing protein 6 isoform X2 [Teleopsis dalmanni]